MSIGFGRACGRPSGRLVLCIAAAARCSFAAAPNAAVRGVAPQDLYLYSSADGSFACLSASERVVPASAINDDFCDCPDGSDEPGTAACEQGRFYCANAGSVPQYVRSAVVNDGVCDCCDGSDEFEGGGCKNSCEDELAGITALLAGHLGLANHGEVAGAAAAKAGKEQAQALALELNEAEEAMQPLMKQFEATTKAFQAASKKLQKETDARKKGKVPEAAKDVNLEGVAALRCYLRPSSKSGEEETSYASFRVNASCLENSECSVVCATLCQGAQQYDGTCAVETSDATGAKTLTNFTFNPEIMMQELFYAQHTGQPPQTEAAAVEHMVPQEGASATQVKQLELKRSVQRLRRTIQPIYSHVEELKSSQTWMNMLEEAGKHMYQTLADTCLNASKEQYVGTTAVREQWHTFHYDVCFSKYITQYEIKVEDEAAKYDEAGVLKDTSVVEEPQKEFLGGPMAFVTPEVLATLPLMRMGIEAPAFFHPSEHLLLFAGGGQCPGGMKRATAVQFVCGLEIEIISVAEVRMCAYVMEVSHPGPCSVATWPKALQQVVFSTGAKAGRAADPAALSAAVQSWLLGNLEVMQIEDGPIDWSAALRNPQLALEFMLARLSSPPGSAAGAASQERVPVFTVDDSLQLLRDTVAIARSIAADFAGLLSSVTPASAKEQLHSVLLPAIGGETERLTKELLASPYYRQVEGGFAALWAALQSAWHAALDSDFLASLAEMLVDKARRFEAGRGDDRLYSLSMEPMDVLVLGLMILVLHMLAAYWISVALRCLFCFFCCCSCCRRRPARRRDDGSGPANGQATASAARQARTG
eukprot:TRINITY_DN100419_c0_g1_i1.p1 TRINITY_DN100419_c0_g1~~TRINITY_DN100419_c0_g1_i1.p1  ORF type:complete len:819 (+),score=231.43 TRINITY_DN100419_c0_g1_i1:132-2588(+)